MVIASCGNATIRNVYDKMADVLKYPVVAGFAICALFAPMHVYRGFGASVFNDWDWGCPDAEYLDKKIKKETSMFSRAPDPQPNRPVLLAFDRAIQVLQVKPMAFLARRPSISSFAKQRPRYLPRSRKEVKEHLALCEDWFHELEKRGHPSLRGQTTSSWGMPFASWTSQFNCRLTKDPEVILLNQMDPGRLLHAFLCRGALNLHDGEIMTLPPATPAEALVCWLAGLPSMTHKLIPWQAFDIIKFEKKVGKKLRAWIGNYPLPSKYVVRDPSIRQSAIAAPRLSIYPPVEASSSAPPPYTTSPDQPIVSETKSPVSSPTSIKRPRPLSIPGDCSTVEAAPRRSLHLQTPVRHAATVPAPRRAPPVPPRCQTQKLVTPIRRKPTPTDVRSSVVLPPTTTTPERAATAPPSNLKRELSMLDSAAPPPRPPKVPLDSSSTHSSNGIGSQPASPVNGCDMSGHYLQLLNAVAQGQLSPEQLQTMLQAPTQQDAREGEEEARIEPLVVTAEPQELDSDPAPPKFMGMSIPRGEIRKAYLAATADLVVHPSLQPGSTGNAQPSLGLANPEEVPLSLKPGSSVI